MNLIKGQPKRLLITSSEFPPGPGGIGTHAYQLAYHLVELGWEIVIISRQDYVDAQEAKKFNSSQLFIVKRLQPISLIPCEVIYRWYTLSKWIKDWKPDLLLASGQKAVWLSSLLALQYRLPWVAVGHGIEFGVTSDWVRRITRMSFNLATAVVCVSQYTWHRMIAMGINPKMGRVISNGADPTQFKILSYEEIENFRASLDMDGVQLLLTVGNVTERKGQDVVIRALPMILEEFPNTHYLLVGLPTKKKELMNLAYNFGVADHVHFLGKVSNIDLVRLFNCCSIFVMTSRHTIEGDFEGYGIAVVEAALCGKPSVVSDNSGLIEAIFDGETGFSVPEDNAIATAQVIINLLKNKELRDNMGESARKRALKNQTWSQKARDYDELFNCLF